MKKTIVLLAVIAAASCQKPIIERQLNGLLSLDLDNSPVVEVVTKADGNAVSIDDFNVYISSDNASFSYIYKDMPPVVTVPVGFYTVSADNVTEAESLSQPDVWGQVRYSGQTPVQEVKAGTQPTSYTLTCTMANTAVSVVFGENIDKHFSNYSVTVYTDESRKLVYDTENTASQTPAVGYFLPKTLAYEFTGTFLEDEEPMTIRGSKVLSPATHLHLTFRISEQNGSVGKPSISVDATCTDLYETLTVDPSGDGSFVTE